MDSTSPVERTRTSMERWRVKLLQRHMYSIYYKVEKDTSEFGERGGKARETSTSVLYLKIALQIHAHMNNRESLMFLQHYAFPLLQPLSRGKLKPANARRCDDACIPRGDRRACKGSSLWLGLCPSNIWLVFIIIFNFQLSNLYLWWVFTFNEPSEQAVVTGHVVSPFSPLVIFPSLSLPSSTCRRAYPQRHSGQVVVAGVVPSPSR